MRKKTINHLLLLPIVLMFAFLLVYASFFSTTITLQADELIQGVLQDVSTSYPNNTTNLNSFAIKSENSFLFTNTLGNNIEAWQSDEIVQFGTSGGSPQNFVSPTHISALPNGNIVVYDSLLKRLKVLNSDYSFLNNYNIIYNNEMPIGTIDKIASMTSDLKNNLYAIDYNAGDNKHYILKYNSTEHTLTLLLDASVLGLTFSQDTQIIVSPNGDYIFLKNVNGASNLYYLKNLSALTQINLLSYGITTVSEIAIDCANNLFVLEKNETLSLLHKLSKNTYEYESFLHINGNVLNNITNIKINVETGTIFALNLQSNTLQTVSPTNYSGTFSENILSFVHPVDHTTPVALTSSVTIANIEVNGTLLLQTPYNISPLHTLQLNEKVIVLSEEVADNNDFAYVLYVNATSENVTGYILKTNLQLLEADEVDTAAVRILNNNTKLYKYPTTLPTNEQILTVGTANKNQEFVVLNKANDLVDQNETSFYAILVDTNTVAYVREIDAVSVNITIVIPTLFTNAEIIITDGSASVLVYENTDTLQTLEYTLEKGKRIYIESYNSEEPYTEIKFLNDNQQEVTGYIQTKYIKVHGDYNNLLQAFILSSISFVLIVLLFVIKSKKRTDEI